MACEQAFKGFGSHLNVMCVAAKKAAHHGEHVGPGTDKRFAVTCGYPADGGDREAETLCVGQDTGRRCRGAGFGRRRIKSPERQIVRARPQSSLCKCEIGVTGYADYGLITEKAAGRCH